MNRNHVPGEPSTETMYPGGFLETRPTIDGPHARAWKIDQKVFTSPDQTAVGVWVVHAPWSHPVWPVVMVSCVHLRMEAGKPDPIIHLPGATHEMVVAALDPNQPIVPPDFHLLHSLNFVGQFYAPSDEHAAARVETSVIEICRGLLNPDTDARSQWILRYGDHCLKKSYPKGSYGEVVEQGGTVVLVDGKPAIVVRSDLPDSDTGKGQDKH